MASNRIPARRLGGTEVSAAGGITDDSSDSNLIAFLRGAQAFCVFNSVPGALSARTRGGTATLCGYDNFVPINPGPQKRFRLRTMGGTLWRCRFNLGIPRVETTVYNGQCSYNAATCAFTQGLILGSQSTNTSVCAPDNPPIDGFGNCHVDAGLCPGGCTATTTVTRYQVDCFGCGAPGSDACCTSPLTGIFDQLSDEDTEADAIARLVAANPYPAFAACAVPVVCALAQYQQRGSVGYSFAYQSAQARGNWTGLPPSRAICVEFDIYRRAYGVGSYALYQTMQVVQNSDGAGNLQVDIDVPNDPGYQSYADVPRAFLPP